MANLLPIEHLREQAQKDVDIESLLTPADDIDFLRNAYRRLVHRPASQNCINNWIGRLQDGSLSRTDVIYGIARSREGREKNVRVLGLNDNDPKALTIPKRKIPWWKRAFSWKSRLPKTSTKDRVYLTERKLACLADNFVEVAEQIEFDLRQIRIQLRNTQSPAVRPAVNLQIDHNDIDTKLEAMNKMLGAGLELLPQTNLEQAIVALKQTLPNDLPHDSLLFRNWAIFSEHPHDAARGCHNAGFEVRTIGIASEESSNDVRSLFSFLPEQICGGIVVDSQLFCLTDRELIHGLTLIHRALCPRGVVLIQENSPDLAFAKLRLESAMSACGFRVIPQNSSGVDAHPGTSVILSGQKQVASENNCDS
ncbi:DUF4214 domain-containing protein [Bremerella cremea]|nr:DUF4214 domain-containing protein [Bremerella cremea]